MSRQERIRQERLAPVSIDTEDCTHLDLYKAAQQEIAEQSTGAHENAMRMKAMDEEFHGKRRGGSWLSWPKCCTAASNGYECNCNQ